MNEVGGLEKHVFAENREASPTEGGERVNFLPGQVAEAVAELGSDQTGKLLAGVFFITGTGQATKLGLRLWAVELCHVLGEDHVAE